MGSLGGEVCEGYLVVFLEKKSGVKYASGLRQDAVLPPCVSCTCSRVGSVQHWRCTCLARSRLLASGRGTCSRVQHWRGRAGVHLHSQFTFLSVTN